MAERDDSYFQQKGKGWFNKPFYNNILSTNIAVYRYLADKFFDGDLQRVVWSSSDMMFRKRQQQVASLVQSGKGNKNAGILDFPFCAFKLVPDAASTDHERTWFNQALNVEGMWMEELGRKVRITPATFNYQAIVVCQSDIDLQYIMHDMLWDASNETLLDSFVDTESETGETKTLKNIVVCSATPHMNSDFGDEKDWLERNKIQAVTIDLPCGTWIMGEDRHRYSITKKVLFSFIEDASLPINMEGDVNQEAEEVVYRTFSEEGVWSDN